MSRLLLSLFCIVSQAYAYGKNVRIHLEDTRNDVLGTSKVYLKSLTIAPTLSPIVCSEQECCELNS